MAVFTINGIHLTVPETLLTPTIERMLEKGWYEVEEYRALKAHLLPGDSVLELGSGIGYLASVCARTVGARNVTTVEANPDLLAIIERNLAANGAQEVTLLHGVVVAGPKATDATFHVSDAFWSATHKQVQDAGATRITVPALDFESLLETCQPTVLIADVEGAEEDFFQAPLPPDLRLIIVELHPHHYAPSTVRALFSRLHDQDFTYHTKGSSGSVIVFARDTTNGS